MKEQNSNRVATLLHPINIKLLEQLLQEAMSASELAKTLKLKVTQICYRLNKLEEYGFISVKNIETRWGKSINYYTTSLEHLSIPVSQMRDIEIESLMRQQLNGFIERMMTDFLAIYRQHPDSWCIGAHQIENQLAIGIRATNEHQENTNRLLGEFGEVYLTDTEALEWAEQLHQMTQSHTNPTSRGQRTYSFGIFMLRTYVTANQNLK